VVGLHRTSAGAQCDELEPQHRRARRNPGQESLIPSSTYSASWTASIVPPEAFTRGEAIHLDLLGVSPRFAGQGVAQGLVSACLTNGMTRGYRLAMTEATNNTSQHVFRKLGFVERVTRPYADHRFNDRAYFDSIADQGGPILMDRELAR
jgi:GNAT superfamily N-acetyltransferase